MSHSNSTSRLSKYGWLLHAVGAVVTAGMAVLFYLALWTPLCEQTDASYQRIDRLNGIIASSPKLRLQQSQLRDELATRADRLAALIKRLPKDAKESEFLTLINQIARKEGVTIRQYQPGGANERGAYSQMTVRLSCDASYKGLCGFVEQLSTLPRLCSVSTMAVRAGGDEQFYPVDITLLIYFSLDPAINVDGQEA